MKFLCLVYANEDRLRNAADSPPDEECQACAESLAREGYLLAGQALQPVSTARTVRIRDGEASVTDGPFAETKEQLAGFYMIEAEGMEQAVALAERIPPARVGSIEVRPIRELDV